MPSLVRETTGVTVAMPTIRDWIRRGVSGVKLHVQRVGGRYYTTASDVEDFLRATEKCEVSNAR
ncbi:DUF1580 domain-containing protein [Planctomycetales bacterium ZRK34]|nr:DUF1580 domain-containing protein [Planctomycetales bacterium ZRK34]